MKYLPFADVKLRVPCGALNRTALALGSHESDQNSN